MHPFCFPIPLTDSFFLPICAVTHALKGAVLIPTANETYAYGPFDVAYINVKKHNSF